MSRPRSAPPLRAGRAAVRARIARAHGHLHGILDMLDDGRPDPEILQQLGAVRAALENATAAMVDDMLESLADAPTPAARRGRETIRKAVRTLI